MSHAWLNIYSAIPLPFTVKGSKTASKRAAPFGVKLLFMKIKTINFHSIIYDFSREELAVLKKAGCVHNEA